MKRSVFAAAIVAIVLALAAGGTFAYFTVEGTARNVVSASNVTVEVEEFRLMESGGLEPFAGPVDVVPGAERSKVVQAKNVGKAAAWVRMKATTAFTLVPERNTTPDAGLVSLGNVDTENWTEKDGWYYYNQALQPGESTKPLFTTVVFSPSMDNLYRNAQVTVVVDAEATQVVHNGESALEAAGWPEVEGGGNA